MDIGQLAERMVVERGVEYDQARYLVDDVFRAMAMAVHEGDALTLPGFGRVVISPEEPIIADRCGPIVDDLHRAGGELLAVASRAADAAERRGEEIDRGIAEIRHVIAGVA